jgi:predicted transcriptional regulator of viral defense system
MLLRDVAACVGITERAAHRIVCELETAGYLTRRRDGRRNVYEIATERSLDDALEDGIKLGDLLDVLAPAGGQGPTPTRSSPVAST